MHVRFILIEKQVDGLNVVFDILDIDNANPDHMTAPEIFAYAYENKCSVKVEYP